MLLEKIRKFWKAGLAETNKILSFFVSINIVSLIIMLLCCVLFCACNNSGEKEDMIEESAEADRAVKGYDLPVSDSERKEAEDDCKEMMGLISELYKNADKGYAVFDEEKQTYEWARLGCFNYALTYFGTSFPEVTDIRENGDGTITLTVDAVCSMILCDDAVITHELTVQFAEDGSFQYLGNKILDDGISNIPEYQYRIITE